MSRYIRTKDNNIYEVKNYFMLPLDYPQFSVVGSDKVFYEAHVKVANSIEELCDMFINTWENGNPSYWSKLENAINEKNSVKFGIHKELLGAVWCDFGLKYVARINNKGEWELL